MKRVFIVWSLVMMMVCVPAFAVACNVPLAVHKNTPANLPTSYAETVSFMPADPAQVRASYAYKYEFYLPYSYWPYTGDNNKQGYYLVGMQASTDYQIKMWDAGPMTWTVVHTGTLGKGELVYFWQEPPRTFYRVVATNVVLIVVTSAEGSYMTATDIDTGKGVGYNFVFFGDSSNEGNLHESKVVVFSMQDGGTNVKIDYCDYTDQNGTPLYTESFILAGKGYNQLHTFTTPVGKDVVVKVNSSQPVIVYRTSVDSDELDGAMSDTGWSLGKAFYFPIMGGYLGEGPFVAGVFNTESFALNATVYEISNPGSPVQKAKMTIPANSMKGMSWPETSGNSFYMLEAEGKVKVIFGQEIWHDTMFGTYSPTAMTTLGRDSIWEWQPVKTVGSSQIFQIPVAFSSYAGVPFLDDIDAGWYNFVTGPVPVKASIAPSIPVLDNTAQGMYSGRNCFFYTSTINFTLTFQTSGITELKASFGTLTGNDLSLPYGRHEVWLTPKTGTGTAGLAKISMEAGGSVTWNLRTIARNQTGFDYSNSTFEGNSNPWTYTTDNHMFFFAGGCGNCWISTILPLEGFHDIPKDKYLNASVAASPRVVSSQGKSALSVHLTDGTLIQPGVSVAITLAQGTVEPASGTTDSYGNFYATFSAPAASSPTDVILSVSASKVGFKPAVISTHILVCPAGGALVASVCANPDTIMSQKASEIDILVTDGNTAVNGASVSLTSSDGGSLTPSVGSTGTTGHFRSLFTAPVISLSKTIYITAAATKMAYIDGSAQAPVFVNPQSKPTLFVSVRATPNSTTPSNPSAIDVVVMTSTGTPIPGALVGLTVQGNGNIAPSSGTTDALGHFGTVYSPDSTSVQIVCLVKATANLIGYFNGSGEAQVLVGPGSVPECMPLVCTFLIAVPAAILVLRRRKK